jgi:hypothetical protein
LKASDLVLGFSDNSTIDLPNFGITINMTVIDSANVWTFSPQVTVTGPQYTSQNASTGETYEIFTGANLDSLSFLNFELLITVVSAIVLMVAVVWVRRRVKRRTPGLRVTKKGNELRSKLIT